VDFEELKRVDREPEITFFFHCHQYKDFRFFHTVHNYTSLQVEGTFEGFNLSMLFQEKWQEALQVFGFGSQ